MARKDVIPVSIVGGVDGGTHPYLQTKLEVMKNCVYDRKGAVTKRPGTDVRGNPGTVFGDSGNDIEKPRGMFAYGDSSIWVGQTKLYTFSYNLDTALNGRRVYKDKVSNCTATYDGIASSNKNYAVADIASGNGFYVIVYTENVGGTTGAGSIVYSVIDSTTGMLVVDRSVVDANTGNGFRNPRLAVIGSTAFLVYYRVIAGAPTLYARTISLSAAGFAGGWSAATSLFTTGGVDGATYHPFDICVSGSNLVVARETSANEPYVATYNTSLVQQATYTGADNQVTGQIAVCTSTDGTLIWVVYGNNTSTRALSLTTALSLSTAAFTASNSLPALLGVVATSATEFAIVGTVTGSPDTSYARRLNTGGAVSDQVDLVGAYRLMSKPWVQDGKVLSLVQGGDRSATETDGSLLVIDWNLPTATSQTVAPRPLCSIAPRQSFVSATTVSASDKFSLSSVVGSGNSRLTATHAAGITNGSPSRISLVRLAFNGPVQATAIGMQTCVASGVPSCFDGRTLSEACSLEVAELNQVAVNGAGSLSAGTYRYKLVREYTDSSGSVHRGAPSVELSVTAALNDAVDVKYYHIGLTTVQDYENSFSGDLSNVIYRTLANGDTFYRLTVLPAVTSGVQNSPTTSTLVTVNDITPDATLATYPQLYTMGTIDGDGRVVSSSAILDNVCPPSAKYICTHNGRFWLAGTPDDSIWYSKKVVAFEGAGFNEALTVEAFDGGRVVGIASDGDRLLVFKESGVWQIYGDGNNDAGLGSTLTDPRKLTDIGCVDARSIVSTPFGTFYQSPRGIFFISKGGIEVSFIGEDVRDKTDGYTICTAVYHAAKNWVRFGRMNSNGAVADELVFDIDRKSWSVFEYFVVDGNGNTYCGPLAACVANDTYQWATSVDQDGDYQERVESASHYTDSYTAGAGTFVPMTIETGWVHLGDYPQIVQRVSRVQVLGEKHTSHALTMTEYTDYYTTARATSTRQSSAIAAGRPEQFEFGVLAQRCEAIKMKFVDSESGTLGTGKGVSIASLVLLATLGRGKFRPAASVAR